MPHLLISCLLLAAAGWPLASGAQEIPPEKAEAILREIQRSHIEGNVPPKDEFHRLLRRDLVGYFSSPGQPPAEVEYELLRDGPTQSGVSYPKYYVWLRVVQPGVPDRHGAARLAAIQRQRFEVTQFLSEAEIERDPSQLDQVFPAAVAERIRAKLSIERP